MTEQPTPRPPIFVVGSPRSGTTLTRLVLDSHPAISCGPETHFLKDLEKLTGVHWRRLERYGFPKEYWYERIRRLYGDFLTEYAESRGKQRWADKTPAYAEDLPFILELFPHAQVVHVIRDAYSVVGSWAKRWGTKSALAAPKVWVQRVSAAREAGRDLPDTQYVELRFERLVSDPEESFRGLFEWLGEPWDPIVLDYDKLPHDGGGRNKTVSADSRGSTGAAINATRAKGYGLNPVLRAQTKRVAGRLNTELGY